MATLDNQGSHNPRRNTMIIKSKIQLAQKGQGLLIFILLSAVLSTIGFSIAQSVVSDNQASQLEQQGKQAFLAAEAGIEAALRRGVDITEGTLTFPGIKKITAIYTSNETPTFKTPIIENNDQFTFYLSSYTTSNNSFGTPLPSSHLIEINTTDLSQSALCQGATNTFAVELTFVDTTTQKIFRRLMDPCDIIDGTVDEWNFGTQYQIGEDITEEANLLILRIVGAGTGFDGVRLSITNPSESWPSQGRSIISEAVTTTNIVRRIRLFSSYPQLPASLFVPSF